MEVIATAIPEVRLVRPRHHADARGWLAEIYHAPRFHAAGIVCTFVQDNLVFSAAAGTLRGLHFQRPPHAQAKLVRVLRGRILDVAVDLRAGSPSFGRHVAVELSDAEGAWLFVPRGFAHGYLTLEANTEVLYKLDAPYAPEHEGGVVWDDPQLAIPWPLPPGGPILSEKDRRLPKLVELVPPPFVYGEAVS